ncbi:TPA: hypothetical protein EYP13_04360 [Candidatus Micrarchaeota archaeon]|nr:hypothetical protein [Candidatus Micrarchaeota archaeon]
MFKLSFLNVFKRPKKIKLCSIAGKGYEIAHMPLEEAIKEVEKMIGRKLTKFEILELKMFQMSGRLGYVYYLVEKKVKENY